MNSDPELLRLLHANPKVFVAGEEYGICHRTVAGEGDHVRDDQRIDALLLTEGTDKSEPQFHARKVCERDVLRRWTGRSAIVPVDP